MTRLSDALARDDNIRCSNKSHHVNLITVYRSAKVLLIYVSLSNSPYSTVTVNGRGFDIFT